jgi:hypothetical protein
MATPFFLISEECPQWIDNLLASEAAVYGEFEKVYFSFKVLSLM